jgi:nitrogen-specific signal transduction histidine kinase/CheY-like chemotaxis protein
MVILTEEIEAHKRTDAALQKAKEVAEAANIAKSRYIVGLSHEIRTPLNAIFGYAQLLERDPAMPTGDAVRVIRRSAAHLSSLVDGLLDMSRVESGTLRLSRDVVRLPEFLDQIVDMIRLQAANKGIAFGYERPDDLPDHVHADERRLRQILLNLLSNAIKYTQAGHAALAIHYRRHVAEFEVSDTGAGIAEEDLSRIFQPFERGRAAEALAQPGTGLGLTIAKLLTEIMGGEITVDSRLGEGSTFRVRMMLSEAGAPEETGGVRGRICGYLGPRIKVLLADDDPTHVDLVRQTLGPLGFVLFTAEDGLAALKMAEEVRPDIALLDVTMPGMDGWRVAAALRATNPRLKIVIVSANVGPAPAAGEEPVHDAFLGKPLHIDRLLDRIEALTGTKWIEAEPLPAAENAAAPADWERLPDGAPAHLDELRQMGRIGYVRGIERKLADMEAEDRAYAPLAAAMRGLVRNFELKRFLDLIDKARTDGR